MKIWCRQDQSQEKEDAESFQIHNRHENIELLHRRSDLRHCPVHLWGGIACPAVAQCEIQPAHSLVTSSCACCTILSFFSSDFRTLQIYIATGQLLLLGGLSLDAGSILASAEAEVFSISPENKLKPKGTTAAVKSRLGLGNRKPLPSAPSSSSLQGPSPDPSVTTR